MIMRDISGSPILDPVDGVKSTKGIPNWLKPIYFPDNIDRIKVLTTLLTSLRSLTLKSELKTDTITEPYKGTSNFISDSEFYQICRDLKLKRGMWKPWESFHLSTKKGPGGQAILTSISEVTNLSSQLIADIKLLGGELLAEQIYSLTDRLDILQYRSLASYWSSFYKRSTTSLRRLSYFSDKEGKTRVIGIVDYWTQSALIPLHKTLNSLLKRIDQDMTFNQNAFSELPLLKGGNKFHSIDLTAATDRFPINFQMKVIGYLIGSERAIAWKRLMVDYEFECKTPNGVKHFSYSTGQPMGAYSSWPAMALSHHFLVRLSAIRAGITGPYCDYFLLGDDLVIYNDLVAEQYKILLKQYDMPFSEAKTHVSFDTFEFAKR